MAQYKIGTISITSGTNVVTGVGTQFLANVSVGDSFKVYGVPALYGVIAVDSNTQLRISPNYAGATVSGGQYQVTTDFTASLGLAEISVGDSEFAFHLTHEVIRKLDVAVAGKADKAGPGSGQAFTVGALSASALRSTANIYADGGANFTANTGVVFNTITIGKDSTAGAGWIQAYGGTGGAVQPIQLNPLGGNVLVGTTQSDATSKVNVIGVITSRTGVTASDARLSMYPVSGGSPRAGLYAYNGNDSGPVPLVLQEGGSSVLVGATTDNGSGAKLQVNGGVTVSANSAIGSTAASPTLTIGRTDGYLKANLIGSTGASGNDFKLQVGTIDALYISGANGGLITVCPAGAPATLTVVNTMTAYLFNNTTLVLQARGSDGVTRSASLALS